MIAACALGSGLGLWARPRPEPAPPTIATATPSSLQIVFDDTPAPLGRPLQVLSRVVSAPLAAPPPPTPAPEPEPLAPPRAAAGLMKVNAPSPPASTVEVKPKAKAKPAAKAPASKPPAKVAVEKPRAVAKAKPATAAKPRPDKPRLEQARVAETKAKTQARLDRAKTLKLAKAEAKASRAKAAKPEKAVASRKPVPRGEGPMRVARATPCASSDPGEALVCANSRLGARDRQLQAAYRNAEAAGVSSASLRRQQARWLQARAAAAREAPWAVEDVYEARISELNDLSRSAREN